MILKTVRCSPSYISDKANIDDIVFVVVFNQYTKNRNPESSEAVKPFSEESNAGTKFLYQLLVQPKDNKDFFTGGKL